MKTNILFSLLLIIVLSSCKKNDPGPNEVFIDNMQYNPASITVRAGTTITWTNKEGSMHTVTSNTGAFSSTDLDKKDKFSFTFTAPGTYSYHCSFHGSMKGDVIVQ